MAWFPRKPQPFPRSANLLKFLAIFLLAALAALVPNLAGATGQPAGTWAATGDPATERCLHTATLLPNGQVLAAGGHGSGSLNATDSAEIYNPATGSQGAGHGLHHRRPPAF